MNVGRRESSNKNVILKGMLRRIKCLNPIFDAIFAPINDETAKTTAKIMKKYITTDRDRFSSKSKKIGRKIPTMPNAKNLIAIEM